jgi:ribosomal protein S8E
MKTGGRKKRERTQFEEQLTITLREKKRNDGRPYSEKTIETHVINLYKLSKAFMGKDEVMNDLTWLYDTDKVNDWIATAKNHNGYEYSVSSKLSFYQAIISCLNTENAEQDVLEPYWVERNKLVVIKKGVASSDDTHHDTTTGQNQKEVIATITPDMIHSTIHKMVVDSFKDGELVNYTLLMVATILKIHTVFPWRNDLADVVYVDEKMYKERVDAGQDKEFNWLVKRKVGLYFVLNNFKTAKVKDKATGNLAYDKIIGIVEDKQVEQMLRTWILASDVSFGDHLLRWEDGRPITRNNISVYLSNETKKYLGHPVSTTLLVKIFNDMPRNFLDMSREDLQKHEKLAALRGHTLLTRFGIYK